MVKKSPCYKCDKRHPACHDTCEDYIDWHADVIKERDELRNPLFAYYRERDTKFIRRHQNSKRNR